MIGTGLKAKLVLGMLFLFLVILSFGGLGIFYINRLSSDAGMILKDNHISLEYCNHMLKALDALPDDRNKALALFEKNLELEEGNITEPGEQEATWETRTLFEQLKKDIPGFQNYRQLRRAIYQIEDVNQIAIVHKNQVALNTASKATLYLTAIVVILSLVAFTFVVSFPGIISGPIKALSEGIKEIANKNYSKRIHLKQKDEFGELAAAFNKMAEKLDEYEHSNLAQIKFEKGRIEAIINKMNDAIIGFDEHRRILFSNSSAEKLFGLAENEMAGKYAPDIALENDLLRTILQEGGKEPLKIIVNNKESFYSKELLEIKTGDTIGGDVIILRNITPFREMDNAKTNFMATISHELKTPIFSIKMSAQLLKDKRVGELNAEQSEILKSMEGNTDRLLTITGELLNLSQIETGKIELTIKRVIPDVIVIRAIQAIQAFALQRKVIIQQMIEPGLPEIQVDEEKTAWVLINLLTNAIKYSSEGGIVELNGKKTSDGVEFSVIDYGRGIDEQYLPHVFDKYYKVPGGFEKTGTGLGLSISKDFIEAQGGRIQAESRFGEGSVFSFKLGFAI
jgi:signal transduction histidine kinase